MSKYLYRCLENYDSVELEDVVFDAREEGDELDKSKNAITLSPQRRPKELVSKLSPRRHSNSSPTEILFYCPNQSVNKCNF